MQIASDLVLMLLLVATLVQALRLERALGVLKRDRAALEQLVASFNTSTRQAEQSTERLRTAADGAGRQLARQIDQVAALKDDLTFLGERAGKLADRLDEAVRAAREEVPDMPPEAQPDPRPAAKPDSKPDHRADHHPAPWADLPRPPRPPLAEPDADPLGTPLRLRSQAERDLLKALRLAR